MSARFERSHGCGFTTSCSSEAHADRALRLHSCERWRSKLAAQQRRAERSATIDRTPKPCRHKQANHQHGTRACYVLDRCRCQPCSDANAASEEWRRRQKAYGRYDKYVDAAQARAHVRQLMDAGMGLKRIVAVSGVSQGVMWKLMYGKRQGDGSQTPTKRVLRTTHDRILAVTLDLAAGARVDNTGTTRRLQALVALGWSQRKLGARLGILPTNFVALAQGTRPVTLGTARAVQALYDELSMQLPPTRHHRDKIAASRARNYAKAHGWLPPLAWDELLDDPTHKPEIAREPGLAHVEELDEAAIYRRMHGDTSVRLSKADAAELVRRWAASGQPLAECERVTGIKPERYYRLRDQAAAS